mgnify:CR=1 FL=1
MKSYFFRQLSKPISILMFIIAINSNGKDLLNAEGLYLKEMEINSSTKFDENNSSLPTNPFEIVEMIRRANSLNDATEPSDAIDDALNSFIIIDEKEKL